MLKISNSEFEWLNNSKTVNKKTSSTPSKSSKVGEVIKSIKESKIDVSLSDNHIAMSFDGARVLTLNEIIAILPYNMHVIFNYKKVWKEKIGDGFKLLETKGELPVFNTSCVFSGFRISKKLVDSDNLPFCFKYLLDDIVSLKNDILKNDSNDFIVSTPCFQDKGENKVAFRLEKVPEWKSSNIKIERLLSQEPLFYNLTGINV